MQISAEIRETFGTLTAKNLRKNSMIPATIFSKNSKPKHITIPFKEIQKAVENYKFLNTVLIIELEGNQVSVLPSSVDFHPVKDTVIHVEFNEVEKKDNVQVLVPILVENLSKSVGIKAGGKLNLPSHSVLVECKPENIPEVIKIDASNFGIGRTIFTKNIKTQKTYSFPKNSFVLSILGRGRKDKGEESVENSSDAQ